MKKLPATRKDAKALGLTRYFTGKPCPRGHIAPHRVHTSGCIECVSLYNHTYRKQHQETHREEVRQWRQDNPDLKAAANKAYRAANAEKCYAHNEVLRAKRRGTLVPEPCKCGRIDVQAHHEDYSKPLEVIWLCPVCHYVADKAMRQRRA